METLPGVSAEARDLHSSAHVIDLHADTLILNRIFGYRLERRHDWRLPQSFGFWQCDLPRFAEGGSTGQFFGLVTAPYPVRGCAAAVLRQIAALRKLCAASPDKVRMVWSAAEVRAAREEGCLAALLGIEGAHALEGDVGRVGQFARQGVRYIGLAHFSSNPVAPTAHGLGRNDDARLSSLGHEVVEEMGRHRMLVDLTHVGRRAFLDAAKAAKGPVIISHTGVRGAYEHWRNVDDIQLRAVADTDGVVGIIFAGHYLGPRDRRTALVVVEHMRHVRRTIGARHLALGSDFDGFVIPVRGLKDVRGLPLLTELLLRDGWQEGEIRGVLGENVLRVLDAHDGK
jgi:membrane dipeptidase